MKALLDALQIDPLQWRELTRTYLVMDFRRTGGLRLRNATQQHASPAALIGLLIGASINSVMIALLVYLIRDTLTAATLMVAFTAATISMLLLIDFTGSVISASDYWVIAPRPVTARTYFAARLSAAMAYVIVLAVVMSSAPALVFLARVNIGAFVGAIIASVLANVASAALLIGVYTYLLAHTHQARLVRAISAVHFLESVISLTGFAIVMRGFEDARIREVTVASLEWLWYTPPVWFGAVVTVVSGSAAGHEIAAAGAAVVVTLGLLVASAGRISLDFASRLGEARTSTSGSPRRRLGRIPGFSEGEAYAVAALVRSQFGYDLRFRLAVLAVLPMTIFYVFLGWDKGVKVDPFNGPAGDPGGMPMYVALVFLPMILRGALEYSDQWPASWIFWATPADHARLVVASKNFVAVFVLGTYLLLITALWAVFYDRVWHAIVHAGFVGAGAHMLLQGTVLISPAVPFAKPPQRAEYSGRLMFVMLVGMVAASVAPILLPYVYVRPLWTIALAALAAAVTTILELALHRRARAYAAELEFV